MASMHNLRLRIPTYVHHKTYNKQQLLDSSTGIYNACQFVHPLARGQCCDSLARQTPCKGMATW